MYGLPAVTRSKTKENAEINQTFCLIATGGHLWMRNYFDVLPLPVRRRLRNSQYNLCPACLMTEVLPKVRSRHPGYSREKALMAAIAMMEAQLRQGR
jgi:hypothetical protein